jgi:hypothetical protein
MGYLASHFGLRRCYQGGLGAEISLIVERYGKTVARLFGEGGLSGQSRVKKLQRWTELGMRSALSEKCDSARWRCVPGERDLLASRNLRRIHAASTEATRRVGDVLLLP